MACLRSATISRSAPRRHVDTFTRTRTRTRTRTHTHTTQPHMETLTQSVKQSVSRRNISFGSSAIWVREAPRFKQPVGEIKGHEHAGRVQEPNCYLYRLHPTANIPTWSHLVPVTSSISLSVSSCGWLPICHPCETMKAQTLSKCTLADSLLKTFKIVIWLSVARHNVVCSVLAFWNLFFGFIKPNKKYQLPASVWWCVAGGVCRRRGGKYECFSDAPWHLKNQS